MTTRLSPQSLIDWLPLRDEESGWYLGRYNAGLRVIEIRAHGKDHRFRLDDLEIKAKKVAPRQPAVLTFGD